MIRRCYRAFDVSHADDIDDAHIALFRATFFNGFTHMYKIRR